MGVTMADGGLFMLVSREATLKGGGGIKRGAVTARRGVSRESEI